MKVLYCGNYLDGTGWGNMAEANILAMEEAGIHVVPRRITYNNQQKESPVQKLEGRSSKGCEVVIQHCLPRDYWKDPDLKCVGIYHMECSKFAASGWQHSINKMDEAWVCSSQTATNSIASGVNIPIKVFSASIDIDKINKIKQKPTARISELKNGYNFCFFGEFIYRKNIPGLITAFQILSNKLRRIDKDINLFFKISSPGMNSEDSLKALYKLNEDICKSLKLQRFKPIHAISGNMRHEDYLSLMSQCHCLVMPSYGEDPCIPALEAQALGLDVVYTSGTGMDEYCKKQYAVDSKSVPCSDPTGFSLPELYSGLDSWVEPNMYSLIFNMELAYNDYVKNLNRDKHDIFDRSRATKIFKELLCQ